MRLFCPKQGIFDKPFFGLVRMNKNLRKFHIDYVTGFGGNFRNWLVDFRTLFKKVAVAVAVKNHARSAAFHFADLFANNGRVDGCTYGVIIFSVKADIALSVYRPSEYKSAQAKNCNYDKQNINEWEFFHSAKHSLYDFLKAQSSQAKQFALFAKAFFTIVQNKCFFCQVNIYIYAESE